MLQEESDCAILKVHEMAQRFENGAVYFIYQKTSSEEKNTPTEQHSHVKRNDSLGSSFPFSIRNFVKGHWAH